MRHNCSVVNCVLLIFVLGVGSNLGLAQAWFPPQNCNVAKPSSADTCDSNANLAACTPNTAATSCTGDKTVCGEWTPPIDICTGDPHSVKCSAVHAALLKTGNVLFWYKTGPTNQFSNSFVLTSLDTCVKPNPTCTLVNVTPLLSTINYDILCAGMSTGKDPSGNIGAVIATGGMSDSLQNPDAGIPNVTFFEPDTFPNGQWVQGPSMANPRFYPSNLQLPSPLSTDGVTWAIGGTDDQNPGVLVKPIEEWAGAAWALATAPLLPDDATSLYPRVKFVPENSGEMVIAGEKTISRIFDPPTQTWQGTFPMVNPAGNARFDGGVVILPIDATLTMPDTRILTAGGNTGQEGMGCPTNTAEIFFVKDRMWEKPVPNTCMCYARYNHNLVLLPDGKVLAVGGGQGTTGPDYSLPIPAPELYDPVLGTWTVLKATLNSDGSAVNRTYHSTALLLPDGRVLSAGSDTLHKGVPGIINDNTFQIFSPPYFFQARPMITSTVPAPNALVNYGSTIQINTSDAMNIMTVALIRPGATTHANDMEQRYVKLAFTQGTGSVTATLPPASSTGKATAPPGYYMLFIVNTANIPSKSAGFYYLH